jgi:hypothetical protein
MGNHNAPWNKGKTGLEAGWTKARRRRASRNQKQRIIDNPAKYYVMFRSGPQPHVWITGPDPEVKRLRVRFNRMRAQAKFWRQAWTISWEDYLDLYKTAPGEWERDMSALNLARIDTRKGWHIWNVKMMTRAEAMRRPTKGKKRKRPKGLGKGRHHWRKKK